MPLREEVRHAQASQADPGAEAQPTAASGCRWWRLPDAALATLAGIYDVMNARALMGLPNGAAQRPFQIEIVGEAAGRWTWPAACPSMCSDRSRTIDATDIVIVPSVLLRSAGWQTGRYPRLVEWLERMHARGALLCSACSGIFLLAETGLFDGKDATVHFAYARDFAAIYPAVTDPSGARAGGLGSARRTDQLRRLDDLARPGALSDRAASPARPTRRKWRACSRCNGIRTGLRPTSPSKAKRPRRCRDRSARSAG